MNSKEEVIEKNNIIDDDSDLLILDKLLSECENGDSHLENDIELNYSREIVPKLREDKSYEETFSYEVNVPITKLSFDEDNLDSSDDEDVKSFLERKYNEYGCGINKILKEHREDIKELKVENEVKLMQNKQAKIANNSNSFKKPITNIINNSSEKLRIPQNLTQHSISTQSVIVTDPVFGFRIIKPLISSSLLLERMEGRKPIPFSILAFHTQKGDLSKDWVVAGVIVKKGTTKMTKKEQPYSIWRLSDLKGNIKTVSFFLFGSAHKDLWKTPERMCIAVLNPNVLEKRVENGDEICLSIDNSQKVMILGQSKDLGFCNVKKRNGDVCNAIVNLNECNTCLFHVKQEFSKMSKRSELQSPYAGRGLTELRNKVLGKSEIFYGGKSFSAVAARKSFKLQAKDTQRLTSLSQYAISPFSSSENNISKMKSSLKPVPYAQTNRHVSKIASNVEISAKQRFKDLERLKTLEVEIVSPKQTTTSNNSTNTSKSVESAIQDHKCGTAPINFNTSSANFILEKIKNQTISNSPCLSRDNFCIEVDIGNRKVQIAKTKAIAIVKQKPLEKNDPNSVRGTKEGKRRAIDILNEEMMTNHSKRCKFEIEEKEKEARRKSRIQRIIDATSSHADLIDARHQEQQEQYFNKMEKKEALEEKMLNTYKVPCKAVTCRQCKYTAFSAADRCKKEGHELKISNAIKRFFQCKNCGNRTVTVFKLPKMSCKNCQSSNWERRAMIRERKVNDDTNFLSIRGDEEIFIGSITGKANLNLIVPDN